MFHALVLSGLALTAHACSQGSRPEPGETGGAGGESGAGSSDGGAASVCPSDCEAPSQFVCDDYDALSTCRCDPERPHDVSECETLWQFQCETGLSPPGCPLRINAGPSYGCACDPTAPTPDECDFSSQFVCATYTPSASECDCDPLAPTDPSDCVGREEYLCWSSDPDIGCQCADLTPIP